MRNRTLVSKWLSKDRKVMSSVSTAFKVHYNKKNWGEGIRPSWGDAPWPLGGDRRPCRSDPIWPFFFAGRRRNDRPDRVWPGPGLAIQKERSQCRRVTCRCIGPICLTTMFDMSFYGKKVDRIVKTSMVVVDASNRHVNDSTEIDCKPYM